MLTRFPSPRRFPPLFISGCIFLLLFAFCASAFARDPHPRRVRNRGDLTHGGWAMEVPGTYGSLYGIRLKDELKRDGVNPSTISKYCPTPEEAQSQGTIPWKCDCFFEPFGPIEEWVKITRDVSPEWIVKYGDQCYAPPFSTSGRWWDWLVSRYVATKQSQMAKYDQISSMGVYLGIDGECRPLKSGDGWKRLDNGSDMGRDFYSTYVPAVARKIQELYPGKVIRIHVDPQMKNLFLENLIDFHRESLEADERQAFLYQGLQFTQLGWWQGFSEHYWVTNSLGLAQDWWPYYLSVLSGLSKHTDMVTGGFDPSRTSLNEEYGKLLQSYVGRDIRDTPGVWSHLRETMRTKEAGGNSSGKYGDYEFYLYRAENLGGNQTVPIKASDIAAINPAVKTQIWQKDLPSLLGANRNIARKVAPGSRFMSFDIDDGYIARFSNQSGVSYNFRIVFFDQGADTFKLQYKDAGNQWREKPIPKTDTKLWKQVIINVTDGVFNNGTSEGANADIYPTDFSLDFGDPAIATPIHFIEVSAQGGAAKDETRPRAQISVDLVRDRNDDPKKGYTSVGLNQTIWVKATLLDSQRRPIPNERVMFTYNTEWNMAKSAYTDSNGVAFIDFSTANRPDSSGFVGGGGTSYRATWYAMTAYFPGSDRYQPSRNDGKLFVTDSPSPTDPRNLRLEIVSVSPIYGDGKVDVKAQLYSASGPVGTLQTKTFGKSDGFYADDPNAQTIGFPPSVHPDGNFMTSNHVTLVGNTNGSPSRAENAQAVNGPGGDQITISWRPNPESDITGYRIFYGTESGRYTKFYGVGKVNTATVSGLEPGRTYFFIVEATNTKAYAGEWSREVSATVGNASILLTVNKAGTGSGTVIGTGINCGDDCLEAYPSDGASVTLTATPSQGSSFAGWSGACSGTGPCAITMSSSKTVTATFNSTSPTPAYTLTASAGSGGTISPSGAVSVTSGTNKSFTITANSGYSIADVKVDGTSVGALSSYTINNVTANHTITAIFNVGSAPTSYTITASAGSGGTISPSGAVTVLSGGSKSFTITPNAGYRIADVLVDGGSQGAISSYTFSNVTSGHTLSASFASSAPGNQRVFAVNCGGPQYRDRSGMVYDIDKNFSGGSTYSTTDPIKGTEDDVLYQTERWGNFSYNIPVANGTYNVTLKFAEIYYGVVRSGQRVFSVSIEGKEVLNNLDLFAQVGSFTAYDRTFPVNVTDGVLNIEFRSFAGNAKVNAIFVTTADPVSQYTITATASGGGRIDPSGAVTVPQGGQKTLNIAPNAGYYTADVKVDGVSKGAGSSYTFNNVTANHTIAASFNPLGTNQYALTVSKVGTGSGEVIQSPSGTVFSAGTVVTLTADPDEGSVFSGWSGGCSGSSSTCTVIMNGNRSVGASFNKSEGSGGNGTYTNNFKFDLNGDGQTDILWQHQTRGEVFVWYMQEAAFLGDEHIRTVEDTNWKIVGVGDFNGDGKADILWHHQARGDVYVWYMNGKEFIRDQFIRTVEDTDWKVVGVGDFNGDGKPDILWRHQVRGDVYVWYMDGATFIRDQYIRTVGDDLNWRIVGVGDFNGDGKPDILWHHQLRGDVYVWYMDGATFLRDQYIRTVGDDLDWKIEGLGDYDGDGKVDILWRHQVRGDVYAWYMDGATFVRDQYIRSVNRLADDLDWRIVN